MGFTTPAQHQHHQQQRIIRLCIMIIIKVWTEENPQKLRAQESLSTHTHIRRQWKFHRHHLRHPAAAAAASASAIQGPILAQRHLNGMILYSI